MRNTFFDSFLFCCFALKINALQQAVFLLGSLRVARSLRFCSTIHRPSRLGRQRENKAPGSHPAEQWWCARSASLGHALQRLVAALLVVQKAWLNVWWRAKQATALRANATAVVHDVGQVAAAFWRLRHFGWFVPVSRHAKSSPRSSVLPQKFCHDSTFFGHFFFGPMRVSVVQKFVDQRLKPAFAFEPRIDLYRAVVPAQTISLVPAKLAFYDLRQLGFAHLTRR